MPHGTGKLEFDNGDVYDGEWKDGNRHRKGIYRFADGELYSGELVDGNPHGRGDYKWADGRVYEGEFANGQQHGLGKMTWPSGLAYEGDRVGGREEARAGDDEAPHGRNPRGGLDEGKIRQAQVAIAAVAATAGGEQCSNQVLRKLWRRRLPLQVAGVHR